MQFLSSPIATFNWLGIKDKIYLTQENFKSTAIKERWINYFFTLWDNFIANPVTFTFYWKTSFKRYGNGQKSHLRALPGFSSSTAIFSSPQTHLMTANVNAELHALQHRERHAHGQHISHDVDGLCLGFRCGRRSQQNLQQGNHILWQAGQHRLIQHFCRSIWHAPLNKIVSNIQICPMIIVKRANRSSQN